MPSSPSEIPSRLAVDASKAVLRIYSRMGPSYSPTNIFVPSSLKSSPSAPPSSAWNEVVPAKKAVRTSKDASNGSPVRSVTAAASTASRAESMFCSAAICASVSARYTMAPLEEAADPARWIPPAADPSSRIWNLAASTLPVPTSLSKVTVST